MSGPANLVDATAIIARLTDENTRLRAAISWVEAPFVDADTDRAEMAARIRMLLDDAGRAAEPRPSYAAPAERASATPAGGGGGTPAGRDGGGAFGAEVCPDIDKLCGRRFLSLPDSPEHTVGPDMSRMWGNRFPEPSPATNSTVASTPSPSASRPPLPLPGGEETRSAAVDDFCAHIGWSPDTEIMVWPLYWGGYVTYRLGDLVEAVPDTIDRLRARGRLGALGGLMERADFNRAAPALAGAFTAMADRPFRAVFHPRNAIGEARS